MIDKNEAKSLINMLDVSADNLPDAVLGVKRLLKSIIKEHDEEVSKITLELDVKNVTGAMFFHENLGSATTQHGEEIELLVTANRNPMIRTGDDRQYMVDIKDIYQAMFDYAMTNSGAA